MLKRQLSRSASICDGFRQLRFIHLGRGFLPLLAVILLAAPSLAFANGLIVTVNPKVVGDRRTSKRVRDQNILGEARFDAVRYVRQVTITIVGGSDSVTVDSTGGPRS